MYKIFLSIVVLFAGTFALLCNAQQTQTAPAPVIDQKSDQLLRQMSDLLANAKKFTFRTKEMHDRVRSNGNKVKVEITREVAVRRPDGMWQHLISKAPDRSRELSLWYDGKTLLMQSDKEKVFARTKVPPTIDEAADYIGSTLNLPTPMADVLYSSPYDAYVSSETSGKYLKVDQIEGKPCHALAFQNPILDWNMWVSAGETPFLCRVDIIYKLDEGSPVISMTFLDWNLQAQITDDRFIHTPPADYQKIQIVGRIPMREEEQPQTSESEKKEN